MLLAWTFRESFGNNSTPKKSIGADTKRLITSVEMKLIRAAESLFSLCLQRKSPCFYKRNNRTLSGLLAQYVKRSQYCFTSSFLSSIILVLFFSLSMSFPSLFGHHKDIDEVHRRTGQSLISDPMSRQYGRGGRNQHKPQNQDHIRTKAVPLLLARFTWHS